MYQLVRFKSFRLSRGAPEDEHRLLVFKSRIVDHLTMVTVRESSPDNNRIESKVRFKDRTTVYAKRNNTESHKRITHMRAS